MSRCSLNLRKVTNVFRGILDNWSLIQKPWFNQHADGFTAPEMTQGVSLSLQGQIRGDEEMVKNDLFVQTTPPVKVDKDGDVVTVTTLSGSIYQIGTPHPEYEKMFPNALERLVDTMSK